MFELTPARLEPRRLPEALGDLVEKFKRASGIAAHFVCEVDEVEGSPRTCREVARILQEALVNVKKHSGARNVLVHFRVGAGFWKLVVDDDGRGYDFEGTLSHESLDRMRRGPGVIKERLRVIGGSLEIESVPGAGSRLEVTIPMSGK
jgi:two-component system sensor histidine kinase DegS